MYDIEFCEPDNYIYVKHYGVIDLQVSARLLVQEMLQAVARFDCCNLLIDYSEAECKASVSDGLSVAGHYLADIQDQSRRFRRVRRAYVFGRASGISLEDQKLFETISRNRFQEVMVFTNSRDALSWLNEHATRKLFQPSKTRSKRKLSVFD